MYKKIITFFICLMAACSLSLDVGAAEKIELSFAYDGIVRSGRYVPVHIDYNSEEEFMGTALIRTINSTGKSYEYEYELDIKAGEADSVRKSYYIPVDKDASTISINVYDIDSKLISSNSTALNYSSEASRIFIGVLSDNPDALSYFDNVSVNKGVNISKVINLDAETFPDNMFGLSQLDIVLISDYRIQDLSDKQSRALMEWVKSGGIMVLGTGKRVDDILGRYAPELLDDMYSDPTVYEIDMSYTLGIESPGENLVSLHCVDVQLHSGNVLVSGDMPLISAVDKMHGFIIVSAYDFVEVSEYANSESEYAASILSRIWEASNKNDERGNIHFSKDELYYSLWDIINMSLVSRIPSSLVMALSLILYIIFVGPVLYILLRRFGLVGHYQNALLIFSLIASIVLYMYYEPVRLHDVFYNYASILDINEGSISEQSFINVRNTDNKAYNIKLAKDYSIMPIDDGFNDTYNSSTKISYDKWHSSIDINAGSPLTDNLFLINRVMENTDAYGVESNISLSKDKLIGSIKSNYPYTIRDAAILLYGKLVLLGDLEASEVLDISKLKVYNIPLNDDYIVASKISGLLEMEYDASDDYIRATEETNFLMLYMQLYESGYSSEARIIGFVDENLQGSMVLDDRVDKFGRSIASFTATVDYISGNDIYKSVLIKNPTALGGAYDARRNSISGNVPVVLEYQLGTDIDVKELYFEKVDEEFKTDKNIGYYAEFEGEMSFFNYQSNKYELKMNTKLSYSKDELEPYLSPSNTLTVRYVPSSSDDMQLPMLTVLGGLK